MRDKSKTTKKDASSNDEHNKSGSHTLPDFMFGVNALFYNVEEEKRKRLTRYLLAYPFDRLFFPIIIDDVCLFYFSKVNRGGGAVASWLVRSSPDRAVQVRALGPVSRKPRKLFGPANPFLVNLNPFFVYIYG